MRYTITIMETALVKTSYYVNADTDAEALELVESGRYEDWDSETVDILDRDDPEIVR
jgi:hypothetical protein